MENQYCAHKRKKVEKYISKTVKGREKFQKNIAQYCIVSHLIYLMVYDISVVSR